MTARLGTLAAVALASVGLGACADDDADKQAQPRPVLTKGTFVGDASGTRGGLVAVVAGAPAQNRGGRRVRVYVCSPHDGFYEWFAGDTSGDRFSLSNGKGSRVEGELGERRASGTLQLRGGQTIEFAATPVRGIAGLYTLRVSRGGSFKGTSTTGGRIEGRAANGSVTQTITAPGGQTRTVKSKRATFTPKGVSSFEGFFIVSDDRIVGGTRSGSKSQPFINQSGDL